jgi:hypothetical protein
MWIYPAEPLFRYVMIRDLRARTDASLEALLLSLDDGIASEKEIDVLIEYHLMRASVRYSIGRGHAALEDYEQTLGLMERARNEGVVLFGFRSEQSISNCVRWLRAQIEPRAETNEVGCPGGRMWKLGTKDLRQAPNATQPIAPKHLVQPSDNPSPPPAAVEESPTAIDPAAR